MGIDMMHNKSLFSFMRKWYLKDGLKKLARHRIMTLPTLAEITKVTRGTFHRYQTQPNVEPHPDNIKRIAEALRMKYGRDEMGIYFYEEEAEKPQFIDGQCDSVEQCKHFSKGQIKWMKYHDSLPEKYRIFLEQIIVEFLDLFRETIKS